VAWAFLLIAGLLEIVWAVALKEADGFARPLPTAIALVAAIASFTLLALALRDLPVGTGYAVWVGIGAAGVAIAGIIWLGESADLAKIGCVVLIVAGVAGLRLLEGG
jgi:quaternary ammonium compound-resistance protein SugE